jgi:hypothetical protein
MHACSALLAQAAWQKLHMLEGIKKKNVLTHIFTWHKVKKLFSAV